MAWVGACRRTHARHTDLAPALTCHGLALLAGSGLRLCALHFTIGAHLPLEEVRRHGRHVGGRGEQPRLKVLSAGQELLQSLCVQQMAGTGTSRLS